MELQKLQQRIIGLLRERDVTATIDEDILVFAAKCAPTTVKIRISVDETALVCRAYIPFFVPVNRRLAMCDAISRANYQLRYVRFEMDATDGELRCRGDLPLFGAEPTDAQITNLIYAVWSNTERYAPALLQVMVAGADPALAIAQVEGFDDEPAPQPRTMDLSVN